MRSKNRQTTKGYPSQINKREARVLEYGATQILTGMYDFSRDPAPGTVTAAPALTPAFGTARGFGLLGDSAVTGSASASTINGNIGIYPGVNASITNFPPSTFTGLRSASDFNTPFAQDAQAAALATYTDLAARAAGTTLATLDGQTLTPGNYTATTSLALAGSGAATVTFNGAGVYNIRVGTTLTTGAGGVPTMTLTNGARAADIYWVIGTSATINSGNPGTFQGNVIADASITVTSGGTINGSLVAGTGATGAVTLSAATTVNTQSVMTGGPATYDFGAQIPKNAVIMEAWADVQTAVTGAGSTYKLQAGSTDITAYAPFDSSTLGLNAVGVQKLVLAAASPFEGIKTSVAGALKLAVNDALFTAGKVRFMVQYYVSKP